MSTRVYCCSKCNKITKTERGDSKFVFGNPFYECRHCGQLNYDSYIVEPALINPKVLIADGKKQFIYMLFLLYMPCGVFLFGASYILSSSILLACLISGIILIPLSILILKKRSQVDISKYSGDIDESMKRLSTIPGYASAVINMQGNDPESAWSKSQV